MTITKIEAALAEIALINNMELVKNNFHIKKLILAEIKRISEYRNCSTVDAFNIIINSHYDGVLSSILSLKDSNKIIYDVIITMNRVLGVTKETFVEKFNEKYTTTYNFEEIVSFYINKANLLINTYDGDYNDIAHIIQDDIKSIKTHGDEPFNININKMKYYDLIVTYSEKCDDIEDEYKFDFSGKRNVQTINTEEVSTLSLIIEKR